MLTARIPSCVVFSIAVAIASPGCVGPMPQYSVKAPVGRTPESRIAITEVAVLSALGRATEREDLHIVVYLKTELTPPELAVLLERLKHPRVTYTSYDSSYSRPGAVVGNVKVELTWLQSDRVDAKVNSNFGQTRRNFTLHGQHRDGEWQFTLEPGKTLYN